MNVYTYKQTSWDGLRNTVRTWPMVYLTGKIQGWRIPDNTVIELNTGKDFVMLMRPSTCICMSIDFLDKTKYVGCAFLSNDGKTTHFTVFEGCEIYIGMK